MSVGRLHVLTDGERGGERGHLALCVHAVAGGADVVQYREKRHRSTAQRVAQASELVAATREGGSRLVVNDRVDVAAAARADGVHLGPRDLAPAVARRLLGPDALIGWTVNGWSPTFAEAIVGADYLGVGPVFGTRSKTRPAPTLGVEELARIARAVALPVIAIGNVTPDRVDELLDAGAHGVAVLSDVAKHPSPDERVARFRERIDGWARARAQADVRGANGVC